MIEVEFIFKQKAIIIQCELDNKMKEFIINLIQKLK